MSQGQVLTIHRYPVKGLSAEALEAVELTPGETLPCDRAYAIENGRSGFSVEAPEHLPKIKFLMLMKNERLAALSTQFDAATQELTIFRHGKRVAGGRLDQPLGRQLVEQFLASYMPADELRGAPKIVAAPGHSFSDYPGKVVSLMSRASLKELERLAGGPVDPLRFRANVMFEGDAPWEELGWTGREIAVGEARLRVVSPIVRCAATNVDPETGARDMHVPQLLARVYGHENFGIYAEVTRGGRIGTGDPVTLS